MTIFLPVVDPRAGFDEDVLDMGKFGNLGFRRGIAAQLVGHDLARCLSTRGKNALEKPLRCSLVAALLQQEIEFGTMLIDGAPQQVRLAALRHKYFVKVPRGAGPATCRLHTVCEAGTELIAPASDRLVADDNPALEQQFFDITQAELKPEIPAYCATDDRSQKAMASVKRFCILHHSILLDHLRNVTVPKFGMPPALAHKDEYPELETYAARLLATPCMEGVGTVVETKREATQGSGVDVVFDPTGKTTLPESSRELPRGPYAVRTRGPIVNYRLDPSQMDQAARALSAPRPSVSNCRP